MVRPKEKEQRIQQTVMLKPSVVKEIERLSEKMGFTKSQFMSFLIDTSLDDVHVLEKLGVVGAIALGKDFMRKFKKDRFDGKVSVDDDGNIEIKES